MEECKTLLQPNKKIKFLDNAIPHLETKKYQIKK